MKTMSESQRMYLYGYKAEDMCRFNPGCEGCPVKAECIEDMWEAHELRWRVIGDECPLGDGPLDECNCGECPCKDNCIR